MPLGIEGSAPDVSDGPYSAAQLLLFERSAKTVDTRVAVHEEEAGAFGLGVPFGKALGENFAHDNVHGGRDSNLTPFLRLSLIHI